MMSDKAIVYRVCAVYGNRWWEWFCGIMSVRGLGERASQPLLLWWELCCASENHISCMSMRMWKRRQPAKQSILFAYSDVMSHFFLVIYVNPFFSYRCHFFLLRFSVHCVSVFFVLLVITAHCHVNQRVCICENRVPFNWSSWMKKMEILTVLWRYHCLEILRDEFSIEKNRLWFLGMRCDLNLSSWFFCAIYLKLAMKFTFFGYLPKRMDTLAKSKRTFRNCWQRQNRAFQFDICPKIMFFLLLVKNVIRNETIKVDGWTERSRDKEREKIQWAIVEHFKTKCT